MMHLLSMTGPAQAKAALDGGFLMNMGSSASASNASWKVVYVFVRYVCPERQTQSGKLITGVHGLEGTQHSSRVLQHRRLAARGVVTSVL